MPFIYSHIFENKKLWKKTSPNIPLHHTPIPKANLALSLLCQKLPFKTEFQFQLIHSCSILSLNVWLVYFYKLENLILKYNCSTFPQSTPPKFSFSLIILPFHFFTQAYFDTSFLHWCVDNYTRLKKTMSCNFCFRC